MVIITQVCKLILWNYFLHLFRCS